MKLFSSRTSLLLIIVMVTSAVVLLVSVVPVSAQDPRSRSINSQDLPEHAEISFDGYISDFKEISHPLNKAEGSGTLYANLRSTSNLYDYSSVYAFASVLYDQGVYVAHWLYVYKDSDQAQRAAAQFIQVVVNQANGEIDRYKGTSQKKGLTGDVITVVNPEDGVELIWYVSTDGNILSLIMVDGVDSDNNKEVFQRVLGMRQN